MYQDLPQDLLDLQALKESVDLWDCQATRALKVQEVTEESPESQDQKELKEPVFLDPQEYLVQLDLQAHKEKTALEHRELQVHLDQEVFPEQLVLEVLRVIPELKVPRVHVETKDPWVTLASLDLLVQEA